MCVEPVVCCAVHRVNRCACLLNDGVESNCYEFVCFFFFFNDTATTEIYTLSLHDALPI